MEPFNSLKNTAVHEMNLVKLLNLIKAIDHKSNISDKERSQREKRDYVGKVPKLGSTYQVTV